jgi:hypothetical protein
VEVREREGGEELRTQGIHERADQNGYRIARRGKFDRCVSIRRLRSLPLGSLTPVSSVFFELPAGLRSARNSPACALPRVGVLLSVDSATYGGSRVVIRLNLTGYAWTAGASTW